MSVFTLPKRAVEVLGDDFGFSFVPQPHHVPRTTTTHTERTRDREELWELLRGMSLAAGDRLDAEVENGLAAWYRPEVLVTSTGQQQDAVELTLRRGAAGGGLSVISEEDGDDIVFRLSKAEHLIPDLIGRLPQLGPIPRRTATLVEEAAEAGTEEPASLDELINPPGAPNQKQLDAIKAFFEHPFRLCTVVSLSMRADSSPRLEPQGKLISWDTEDGRFMVTEASLPGGGRRISCIPADGSALVNWLHERIDTVREDRR